MEKDWEFNSLVMIRRIQGVKESRIQVGAIPCGCPVG